MSHVKNKRRAMQWERYHQRWPQSGREIPESNERIHGGHTRAIHRFLFQGRPGVRRDPWYLFTGRGV